jgi:regulator of PEP synthase PpsR (kinase-PPPase family)
VVDPTRIEVEKPSVFDCLILLDSMRDRTARYDEMMPWASREDAEVMAGVEHGVLGVVIEHLMRLDPEAAERYSQYRLHRFDEAYQGRIASIEYSFRSDDALANPHIQQ